MSQWPHSAPREFTAELERTELALAAGPVAVLSFHGGCRDAGRAVLCLAGMGARGRSFARQQPLARDWYLLLVDLPQQTPADQDPVLASARTVEELIERLALDRPVLLGTSFGGAVAAQVALDLGDRLRALVLVSAIISRRQIPLASPAPVELLEAPEVFGRLFAPLAVQIMGGRQLDREAREEIVREARVFSAAELKRRLLSLMRLDLLGSAGALTVPSLVIHGSRDRLVWWQRGRWAAEAIPGARFELMRGAGHLPYLTQPDRFNALLGAFLEGLREGTRAETGQPGQ